MPYTSGHSYAWCCSNTLSNPVKLQAQSSGVWCVGKRCAAALHTWDVCAGAVGERCGLGDPHSLRSIYTLVWRTIIDPFFLVGQPVSYHFKLVAEPGLTTDCAIGFQVKGLTKDLRGNHRNTRDGTLFGEGRWRGFGPRFISGTSHGSWVTVLTVQFFRFTISNQCKWDRSCDHAYDRELGDQPGHYRSERKQFPAMAFDPRVQTRRDRHQWLQSSIIFLEWHMAKRAFEFACSPSRSQLPLLGISEGGQTWSNQTENQLCRWGQTFGWNLGRCMGAIFVGTAFWTLRESHFQHHPEEWWDSWVLYGSPRGAVWGFDIARGDHSWYPGVHPFKEFWIKCWGQTSGDHRRQWRLDLSKGHQCFEVVGVSILSWGPDRTEAEQSQQDLRCQLHSRRHWPRVAQWWF